MELWQYRDYIIYSVRAKLLSETMNNHLGIFWLALEPLLRMFVYYFVFVFLIRVKTENFISFLLIGIMALMCFTKTVMQGGNSIKASGGLIRQRYVPKIIFPTISSLTRTVDFLIVLTLLMLYYAVIGPVYWSWVTVPCVVLTQFLFTYGLTLFAAAIIPFVPDMSILINSAMTALFFLSGVFYEILPADPHYKLFMLNPVAKLLEQYRRVLLHGQWPDWLALLKIGGLGIVGIVLMSLFIRKMDRSYPRYAK